LVAGVYFRTAFLPYIQFGGVFLAHQLTYQTCVGRCKRFSNYRRNLFRLLPTVSPDLGSVRRLVQNIRNVDTPQGLSGDLPVENVNPTELLLYLGLVAAASARIPFSIFFPLVFHWAETMRSAFRAGLRGADQV